MMKRNNSFKAFTLLELMVVIAIIGVLAAILIPSISGYIKKAQKAVDITNAKQIFEAVQLTVLMDDNAEYSFAGKDHGYRNPQQVNVDGETYKVSKIADTAGYNTSAAIYQDNKRAWQGSQRESNDFADALNKTMGYDWNVLKGKRQIAIPLKYSIKRDGMRGERWNVCARVGQSGRWASEYHPNASECEIWVGTTNEKRLVRLYPNPDQEYADGATE